MMALQCRKGHLGEVGGDCKWYLSATGVTLTCVSSIEPLPFRIDIPDQGTIDSTGVRSVKYRIEGLLQLVGGTLAFEWNAVETIDRVGLGGVHTDVDESPIGRREVPLDWISQVRLRGGWLRPQLVLRARRLDAFVGMPGRKQATLILQVGRRFRRHAKALLTEIESARKAAAE